MFSHSLIALSVVDRVNLAIEGSGYQIVGIMVVMGCLGFLAIILGITAAIATRLGARKAASLAAKTTSATTPAPAKAAVAVPASSPETLSPELVAVISAAVSVALEGMNHRILEIKQAPYSGYSSSGRSEIFASHRIRPSFSSK